ncbi:MAG: peptide chain release factor N(5)-glutamine methyltransferase [Candidatus Magasanikbacteria bacterium]
MFRINTLLKKAIRDIDALDAQLLLAHALRQTREFTISHPNKRVGLIRLIQFFWYVKKRKNGIPFPYITGTQDFYGNTFNVSPLVLIPRPASELLVEAAKETITDHALTGCEDILYIDIATGSGCIPISVMKSLDTNTKKHVYVCGSDISWRALRVAKKNKTKHESRIEWLRADLFDTGIFMPIIGKHTCLIITANLPYLKKEEKKDKSIEREPNLALYGGGSDGLALYRRFFAQLEAIKTVHTGHLRIFLECDPEQIDNLLSIIKSHLPNTRTFIQKDLAGLDRVIGVAS